MERLTKSFSVFDCDAHINDPMGIWDYVPESQKELVRNTYWRGDAEAWLNGTTPVMGGGNAHFPGYNPICIAGPQMNKKIMRKLNSMPLTAEQKAYLHHDGAIDPRARLTEMDLMGIDQVLVIPTMVIMHVPFAENAEGVDAFCQAYNNFVADWCHEESSRLFAAAFLPAQDPGYTAKEIHRAAELGLPVGLIRPIDAQAKYPNAAAPSMMAPGAYDAVFRAFEETGMVLGMHTFPAPNYQHPLGRDYLASPGELFNRAGTDSQTFSFVHEMQVWLSQVLLTGLLDRYPKMKMAVFESNAEWLPYTLETCDRQFKLYARERGTSSDRLPSEAFHQQCVISFESDETGVFRQWEQFAEDRDLGVGRVPPRRRRLVERDAQHDGVLGARRRAGRPVGWQRPPLLRDRGEALRHRRGGADQPARLVPAGSRARRVGRDRGAPARERGEDAGAGPRPVEPAVATTPGSRPGRAPY